MSYKDGNFNWAYNLPLSEDEKEKVRACNMKLKNSDSLTPVEEIFIKNLLGKWIFGEDFPVIQ